MLFRFPPTTTLTDDLRLPQGRGFRVEVVDAAPPMDSLPWVAIVRQPTGSETMFARMADDVVALLQRPAGANRSLLRLFTGRIRAWQAFMEQDHPEVLSFAAETGLVGELLVLQHILDRGASESVAVDGWCGPLDGLHDFSFSTGALEAKATVTSAGFPAVVGSLDQLDPALVNRLYLVGVRLSLETAGQTLPDLIATVRERLSGDEAARADFDDRVLHAGFLDTSSHSYRRRFAHVQTTVLRVRDGFPGLTAGTVHRAIRRARYELDLDLLEVPQIRLETALAELQVV